MFADDNDKLIANAKLTPEQRDKIAKAQDRDNSDIDFCDCNGKLMISYCWGNQVGKEFIAEAEYVGSTSEFLRAWFPDMGEWAGIDVTQPLSTFAGDRKRYGSVLSAEGATVTTSSADSAQQRNPQELLSGSCTRRFAFHTKPETNPWVQIDLGRPCAISGVLARNRTDARQERAEKLRLQVSVDGTEWHRIWEARSVEQCWEIPLLEQNITAQYMRLDSRPAMTTPFHLQHVEVWGALPKDELPPDGGGWGFSRITNDDAGLPRVLLIGDSIANGYHKRVAALLKAKANVDLYITPRIVSSPDVLKYLERALTHGPYRVIHFNESGLHAWPKDSVPEGKYGPLFADYVKALQEHSEQAKLIWATSTPVTINGKPGQLDAVVDATVTAHNEAVRKVVEEQKIPVDDLHALMMDKLNLARGPLSLDGGRK